jgi:formamidopyrimidine-DNA glycosylase
VPELPEVETVVRDLRPHLVGKRITAIELSRHRLRHGWAPEWSSLLIGRRFNEVRRRGKWIVMVLDHDGYLVFHLGMTGQLRMIAADEPREDHTHLVCGLRPGRWQLQFRDVRRFGSATLFVGSEQLEKAFTERGLGPEPADLDGRTWRERLASTRRCLKAVLLDQRSVAGVGNIYADESLYEARLAPIRLGNETSRVEAERLRKAIVAVLNRAIERRGSTIRDYVGGSGLRGQYQDEFRVYGRAGKPCRRCATPIERIRLAGRSTYFCRRCQSMP